MKSKEHDQQKKLKLFVLDTNVILHDSRCLYKFEENDVIIPIQVIEELDNFKKGLDSINYNARDFLRIIDELSTNEGFNGGLSLGKELGTIKISLAFPIHSQIKKNLSVMNVDASIINTAYKLQTSPQYKNHEVIIVSKDANLRQKARALNIIAQDYLSETVVNVDLLLAPTKEVSVSKSLIDRLYQNGKVYHDISEGDFKSIKPEDLINNQTLLLKSETQGKKENSALSIFKEGRIKLVYKERVKAFNLRAKNAGQAFGMDFLLDPDISLITIEGRAGTGKTIIALASGLEQMEKDIYSHLHYTRQTISVGDREIGFLPGDVEEKLAPFMNGMGDNLDVLSEIPNNINKITDWKKQQKIVVEPISFIRGRSLNRSFFIIDEAQNLTPHEVKTLVTRAGEGTKMVFIGDTRQIDHPYLDQKSNGLSYLIEKMRGQSCYAHVTLDKGERSFLAELAGKLL